MTPIFLKHTLRACHTIKSLSLNPASYGDHRTTVPYPHIDGLPTPLQAIFRLNRLKPKLPEEWDNELVTVYSYDQVFPRHQKWMELESFEIESHLTGAKDLQSLVASRMPNLRRLSISSIKL